MIRAQGSGPRMAAGAVVFDYRPAVLPVSVDVLAIDMQTVRHAEPPAESVVAAAERKPEFRGPMWLDDIDPELEVTPLLDSGTDCQDESAWLLSRDPEYWVEHMGREKTLSAALQLQHDAGLILSNVQILQQLVTVLYGAFVNAMRPSVVISRFRHRQCGTHYRPAELSEQHIT